ncbi:MAG: PIG-L deacetylase family protein [Promethearchaeota archaeon]
MKIVVFAPHPDDEIYGCGGSILRWMDEGHEVHVIYVTDNRVLISWGRAHDQLIEEKAKPYSNLNEDEIAEIGLKEAKDVAKSFGFAKRNIHLFKFHDQGASNRIDDGVNLATNIIKDANRIVLPSDNNNHVDHQATHIMAKSAAISLGLDNIEFYVYASYNILKVSRDKQIKVDVIKYRDKLYEIMGLYRTQLCLKDSSMGREMLKRRRKERFGVFHLEDANNFYNF